MASHDGSQFVRSVVVAFANDKNCLERCDVICQSMMGWRCRCMPYFWLQPVVGMWIAMWGKMRQRRVSKSNANFRILPYGN